MISSEMSFLLKEAIQNELHIAVDVFDNRGNLVSISPNTTMRNATLDIHAVSVFENEIIPVYDGAEIVFYLKCEEAPQAHIAAAMRMFARAVVGYERKDRKANRIFREETVLMSRMLSEEAAEYHNDIIAYGADLGYKLEHPMAMIVASLETNYNYCLNMNLGYESATIDAKNSVLKIVKEHMYMNKQDLVAFVQNNCLVILKAIEELNDIPKLYKMIGKVSEMVSDVLKSYRIFRYYVAPGEIVENFDTDYQTYQEALEHISFAQKMNLDHTIITQDDVLYYSMTKRLPNQLRIEIVEPKVKQLLSQNREMVESLIQCFDAFVDNGFNIASTADAVYLHRNTVKKRMDKLCKITGFDPFGDFKDVMMNKLILQQYLVESRER